MIIIYYT